MRLRLVRVRREVTAVETDFTQYHIGIARAVLVHLGCSIADSREPGADRDVEQLAEVIARAMQREHNNCGGG
jgi:hydrogenase maturation factor